MECWYTVGAEDDFISGILSDVLEVNDITECVESKQD